MKIAIIGGGMAGLCAATYLASEHQITLFEAGRRLGGRARAISDAQDALDNGQHILLGAYTETLALLKKVGAQESELFKRYPLTWIQKNGLDLRAWKNLGLLGVVLGLLQAKGIGFADKYYFLSAMLKLKLKGWCSDCVTVAQWLDTSQQTDAMIEHFWRPLVLSALNTPLHLASMQVFCAVLKDSMDGVLHSSDLLIPRKNLSETLVSPILQYLEAHQVRCQLACRVQSIQESPDGVYINDERFDAVMIACAPYHLAKIQMPLDTETLASIASLHYEPIYTVYLDYGQPLNLAFPMLGLKGSLAHWFFDREALLGHTGQIAAVISASGAHESMSHAELILQLHQDVQVLTQRSLALPAAKVIVEKRATFAASVKRVVPKQKLSEKIYLAGDWTHASYPATLEGAVRSALVAVHQFKKDWNLNEPK